MLSLGEKFESLSYPLQTTVNKFEVPLQLKLVDDLMMKSSDEFRSHLGETENTKSMSILMATHNLI